MRWLLAIPALLLAVAPLGLVLVPPDGLAALPPPGTFGAFLSTLAPAAASAAIATTIGAPAALAAPRLPRPVRTAVLALLAAPWLVPAEALALALAPLATRAGDGAAAVLAGTLIAVGPVVALSWPALRDAGPAERRVAGLLGASRGLVLRRLVLPRFAPALSCGALLGFAAAANAGAVARLLAPAAGDVASGPAIPSPGTLVVALALAAAIPALRRAMARPDAV